MRRVKGNSALGTVFLTSDQRDHTHHSDKKKKKKPSLDEWKGCWEKRKKRGMGDQCLDILQQHPSGWHYAWLTCSIDQLKKEKKNRRSQDRELHLRAHVLSRSCTVSRKEKEKPSSSRAGVWLNIANVIKNLEKKKHAPSSPWLLEWNAECCF